MTTFEDDQHRLVRGIPPEWASAWGWDEYGVFAGFCVGEVEQRMRWIPAGKFWMGSADDEAGRWDDEGPRHEVTLTQGYWLADTPCTQALWREVMGSNPSRRSGSLALPVESVSWHDVQKFMVALGRRVEGLNARLPAEAQWERACRADGDAPRYGEARDIAWYRDNSGNQTHEVGRLRPNAWGLYDMLGNVWEWCDDDWSTYPATARVDPLTQGRGPLRVFRGGSWSSGARHVRAAYRLADEPGDRYDVLGFRLLAGQGQGQAG